MFGDVDKYEKQIRYLLDNFSLDEITEMLDITPEACISILLNEGHAVLPPFLEELDEDDDA